jgi:hypothetical protein
MAHFARVDKGIVKEIIVAEQDFFDSYVATEAGEWIQCSYNTRGGVHYQSDRITPSDDQTKALRKNYPSPNWTYDKDRDAFIAPKPFNSWILNETTCCWEAPVAYPNDGQRYIWNETIQNWELTTEE